MKTSCSVISPRGSPSAVTFLTSRALTVRGAEKVISRSRQSASVYFGLPKGSSGTMNSSDILPAKSVIGDISRNSSLIPSRWNHWKESSCIWISRGSGSTSSKRANERRRSPETCRAIHTPRGDTEGAVGRKRELALAQQQVPKVCRELLRWHNSANVLTNSRGRADIGRAAQPADGRNLSVSYGN